MQDYDINCIGAGAEGSSMTFKLAQTGRETLLFEIGFVRNEKGNGDGKRVVAESIYCTNEKWQDRDDKPLPLPMTVKLPQNDSEDASLVKLENFSDFPDPTDRKADRQTNYLTFDFLWSDARNNVKEPVLKVNLQS